MEQILCKKHFEPKVPVGAAGRLRCKSCNREHQAKYVSNNKEIHAERNRKSALKRRQKEIEFYLSLFDGKSCIDCSEDRIPTLDFDHIDPSTKLFSVSQGFRQNYSKEQILEEVNKCVIRCANCHRMKTAKDNNWYGKKW